MTSSDRIVVAWVDETLPDNDLEVIPLGNWTELACDQTGLAVKSYSGDLVLDYASKLGFVLDAGCVEVKRFGFWRLFDIPRVNVLSGIIPDVKAPANVSSPNKLSLVSVWDEPFEVIRKAVWGRVEWEDFLQDHFPRTFERCWSGISQDTMERLFKDTERPEKVMTKLRFLFPSLFP